MTADSPERAPDLDPQEEKKAQEEESLTADVTYEVIRREGKKELERSLSALWWSGLAAGLAMAFTFIAEGILRAHLPDAPWRPLITKLGYPLGFLIVIMGSQQLYTENTLFPVVNLLVERTMTIAKKMLSLWAIVLLGNLVGAFIMGWVLARTALLEPETKGALRAIALESIAPGYWTVLLRAIVAGWLIAGLVWMLPAAESAHVTVILVMTYLVGIGLFSHVIAGSVGAFYLVAAGDTSIGAALAGFTLPALIGNTVGGVTLVAALNHAQVSSS
ncbi:MAG TPA: formate/nitrite transporter family protein [Gemmatimonadaceae bacterium]|nr:formate/nitrite transporter family protein [Gemmatimonadaceae bacterium]